MFLACNAYTYVTDLLRYTCQAGMQLEDANDNVHAFIQHTCNWDGTWDKQPDDAEPDECTCEKGFQRDISSRNLGGNHDIFQVWDGTGFSFWAFRDFRTRFFSYLV